jgi:hypothetical protein
MSKTSPAVLLTLIGLAACGGGIHKRFTFEQAVTDPQDLVTTADPAAMRSRLAATDLPRTREHEERIEALLRSRSEISAAHLALLASAIGHEHTSLYSDDKGRWTWGTRGRSEGSAAVERILNDGLPKITTIDRHWYGQLLGLTHSDATLQRYVERFHQGLDDGSQHALFAILDGMPGSPAMVPFAVTLRDIGKADDARCWVMFQRLSFDDDRVALLRALLPKGFEVDRERLLAGVGQGSFDEGRRQLLELLAEKAPPLAPADAKAVVAMFSFDDGRGKACATLARSPAMHLGEATLAELLDCFSFDGGRLACVRALAPLLQGAPDGAGARRLLGAFSFDNDRLAAVRILAPRWQSLPPSERTALTATFSFDSGTKSATDLLMR